MQANGQNGKVIHRTTLLIDEASLTARLTLYELLPMLIYFRHIILTGGTAQNSPFCSADYELRSILECMETRVRDGDTFIRHSFLNVQYRMPRDIGDMVSKNFYGGRVRNFRQNSRPGNLYLYDLEAEVDTENKSRFATKESVEAIRMAQAFRKKRPGCSIAILVLYTAQLDNLYENSEDLGNIKCSTVDAFQGGEADVIIVCTTIYDYLPKFTTDRRRLCVSMSRAKQRLAVMGSAKLMKTNRIWKSIIKSLTIVNSQNWIKVL